MSKKRFIELFAKSRSETLNRQEKKEMDKLLNSNPEFEKEADSITYFWDECEFSMDANGDHVYSIISTEINDNIVIPIDSKDEVKKTKYFTYSRIAVSIVFFLIFGFVTVFILGNIDSVDEDEAVEMEVNRIEKYIPSGQKLRIFLPDGSIVWLNSETNLFYPEVFEDKVRVVELEGEAFFEVVKDPDKPFIVKSGDLSTTALGTSFNVKGYATEDNIEVTLATGKVLVEIEQEANQKFILDPGFSVNYLKKDKEAIKLQSDIDHNINWKDGVLQFEEDDLHTVFKKLGRWYGVQFEFSQPYHGSEWKYSGWFKNDYLDNVLISISFAKDFDFDYNIDRKKVTITFKN